MSDGLTGAKIDHLGIAVGQRYEAARHARGPADQALGPRLHDDDVGAGALDGGGEALADADEDPGHGQHQQARQGQGHDGGHVAPPLIEQG